MVSGRGTRWRRRRTCGCSTCGWRAAQSGLLAVAACSARWRSLRSQAPSRSGSCRKTVLTRRSHYRVDALSVRLRGRSRLDPRRLSRAQARPRPHDRRGAPPDPRPTTRGRRQRARDSLLLRGECSRRHPHFRARSRSHHHRAGVRAWHTRDGIGMVLGLGSALAGIGYIVLGRVQEAVGLTQRDCGRLQHGRPFGAHRAHRAPPRPRRGAGRGVTVKRQIIPRADPRGIGGEEFRGTCGKDMPKPRIALVGDDGEYPDARDQIGRCGRGGACFGPRRAKGIVVWRSFSFFHSSGRAEDEAPPPRSVMDIRGTRRRNASARDRRRREDVPRPRFGRLSTLYEPPLCGTRWCTSSSANRLPHVPVQAHRARDARLGELIRRRAP